MAAHDHELQAYEKVNTSRLFLAIETHKHVYLLDEHALAFPGSDTMANIIDWYIKILNPLEKTIIWLLCKRYCIKTGTFELFFEVPPDDSVQAATSLREVVFPNLVRDEVLTTAFTRSLTDLEASVAAALSHSFNDASDTEEHAVVVCLELEKNRVVLFFILSVILGIVVAVGVGAGKHDPELGAAVGGAIAGFLALVHFAVVWKYS